MGCVKKHGMDECEREAWKASESVRMEEEEGVCLFEWGLMFCRGV